MNFFFCSLNKSSAFILIIYKTEFCNIDYSIKVGSVSNLSKIKMSFNLGFIGGGNMSTAIMKGILKHDAHPASKIWVSGPHIERLTAWSDLGTNVTTVNGEVCSLCDVIFIGVKPNMLHKCITESASMLGEGMASKRILFISMLVGVTLETLKEELKIIKSQPSIIRILPNTPMTVGSGCCLYSNGVNVEDRDYQVVENLLKTSSVCERVPESLIDSLGTVTGCGPAFLYVIIEALSDGAVKQGVPRDLATKFAAQMVVGSGKMVLESGKHPGLLKDEVCSPGGSTICGITAMENAGVRAAMINAVEAAVKRTKEMAEKK